MNTPELQTSVEGHSLDAVVRARRFTTRSSAHGSDYVPLSNPERYDMTLEEAEADVRFWRAYADTVGGDAIIVECPNDRTELTAAGNDGSQQRKLPITPMPKKTAKRAAVSSSELVIPPCACVHYDATDCARIRDGFYTDDERYEGYRRKCGCECHNHDDDDEW